MISNFSAMLEAMPAHSKDDHTTFEKPDHKNSDDNYNPNDCDSNTGDPQIYRVFRESNQRRDDWRRAVLEGDRKDKRMPYDASHRAFFGLTDISSKLEKRLQQCGNERWFSPSELIKAYAQACE